MKPLNDRSAAGSVTSVLIVGEDFLGDDLPPRGQDRLRRPRGPEALSHLALVRLELRERQQHAAEIGQIEPASNRPTYSSVACTA